MAAQAPKARRVIVFGMGASRTFAVGGKVTAPRGSAPSSRHCGARQDDRPVHVRCRIAALHHAPWSPTKARIAPGRAGHVNRKSVPIVRPARMTARRRPGRAILGALRPWPHELTRPAVDDRPSVQRRCRRMRRARCAQSRPSTARLRPIRVTRRRVTSAIQRRRQTPTSAMTSFTSSGEICASCTALSCSFTIFACIASSSACGTSTNVTPCLASSSRACSCDFAVLAR